MGRSLAGLWHATHTMNDSPSDILDYGNMLPLLCRTFDLTQGWIQKADYIASKASTAAENLTKQLQHDPTAHAFVSGLKANDLTTVLSTFQRLQTTITSQRLPNAVINGDFKRNNMFIASKGADDIEITTWFDFDTAGWAPRIKDLGRTIMFECFENDGNDFNVDKAKSLIQGAQDGLKDTIPLTADELRFLGFFIQESCCIQYALRTSYYAEEIAGKKGQISIDRPDPSLHVRQLGTIQKFLKTNRSFQHIMQSSRATTTVSNEDTVPSSCGGGLRCTIL